MSYSIAIVVIAFLAAALYGMEAYEKGHIATARAFTLASAVLLIVATLMLVQYVTKPPSFPTSVGDYRFSLKKMQHRELMRFTNYFHDYTAAQQQLNSLGPFASIFGRFEVGRRVYILANVAGNPLVLEPCDACSIAIDDAPQWEFELGMRTI